MSRDESACSPSSTAHSQQHDPDIVVPHAVATKTHLSSTGAGKLRMLHLSDNIALLTGGTIANGTFGKLRIGVDLRGNRAVAIKEFGHGDSGARRDYFFNQEVLLLEMLSFGLNFRGAYALSHKNRWGYMMTCMDGSIDKVTSTVYGSTPQIRIDVARHTGKKIAAELKHYHAAGFLHGDVKPHNILFNGEGLVCLGDHGSVVPLHSDGTSQHGSVGCTIQSPEYFMGGPGDYRLDIFALGYALWKLYVPNNYFYGIGEDHRAFLSPYEHHQLLDWVITGDAPEKASTAVHEAKDFWQQFTTMDPAVASFVLHGMLKDQVSAAAVAQFFNQPSVSVPLKRVQSHFRAAAARLPAHLERQRLHDAAINFWTPTYQVLGSAAAFKERHEQWLLGLLSPKATASSYPSFEQAETKQVKTLAGAIELVRMAASDRYYVTSAQVAAHGTKSLAKVALYKEHDRPVLLREFSNQPTAVAVARGGAHALSGMHWQEHFDEEAIRNLLGPSHQMSVSHRIEADSQRLRVIQQAYLCTAHDLAQAAPIAARLKLAYRMLEEGSQALHRVHEMGLAHGRMDSGHLLFSPHTPLALAGLSKLQVLGSKPGAGALEAATHPSLELLLGGHYSQASDMWSLGVSIWRMVAPEADLSGLRLRDRDLFRASSEAQAFHLWRCWTLYVPNERKPEAPKKCGPNRLTDAWRSLEQKDAMLAHFILESMLCPETDRCSTKEAIDFARANAAQQTTSADDDALERLASIMPVVREHERLLAGKHELILKHRRANDLKAVINAEFAASGLS